MEPGPNVEEELRGLPAIGTVISNKYRLDELIGRGGMAAVYSATQLLTRRRVAIKWLYSHIARNAEVVERFLREARAASLIDHPNVVSIFDVDRHEQSYYIVMELLSGETLRERLARGRLDSLEAIQIAMPVCSALASAHRHGIIHRDLKPENVFLRLREDGTTRSAKVLDFGISKLTAEEGLTLTGTVVGTPYYLSPEQASGEPVGPTADVYQLGVLLYEMLAGSVPFDRDNYAAILCAIIADVPEPLTKLRPDLPTGIVSIVERAMARDPKERYQNAEELAEALAPFSKWIDNESFTSISSPSIRPLSAASPNAAVPDTRASSISEFDAPAVQPGGRLDAGQVNRGWFEAGQVNHGRGQAWNDAGAARWEARPDEPSDPHRSAVSASSNEFESGTLPLSPWPRVLAASGLGAVTMVLIVGAWIVLNRPAPPPAAPIAPSTEVPSPERASATPNRATPHSANGSAPSEASRPTSTNAPAGIDPPEARPARVSPSQSSDAGQSTHQPTPRSGRESPFLSTSASRPSGHATTRSAPATAPEASNRTGSERPASSGNPSVRAGRLSVDDF